VIEDITTAIGAQINNQYVGSTGRLVVASFGATKLVCAGEGGAIAGQPSDVVAAQQWSDPESCLVPEAPVFNAKLSDVCAALGASQLTRLTANLKRRRAIAAHYDDRLGHRAAVVVRPVAGSDGTWWRYLVRVKGDPDTVVQSARAAGVWFARPVPHQNWAKRGRFPVSDSLFNSLVSVPIYPALTDTEVEAVGKVLDAVVDQNP
jgi:dTDP-4-amino-4,6-dideoxygalactose transaminase